MSTRDINIDDYKTYRIRDAFRSGDIGTTRFIIGKNLLHAYAVDRIYSQNPAIVTMNLEGVAPTQPGVLEAIAETEELSPSEYYEILESVDIPSPAWIPGFDLEGDNPDYLLTTQSNAQILIEALPENTLKIFHYEFPISLVGPNVHKSIMVAENQEQAINMIAESQRHPDKNKITITEEEPINAMQLKKHCTRYNIPLEDIATHHGYNQQNTVLLINQFSLPPEIPKNPNLAPYDLAIAEHLFKKYALDVMDATSNERVATMTVLANDEFAAASIAENHCRETFVDGHIPGMITDITNADAEDLYHEVTTYYEGDLEKALLAIHSFEPQHER